MTPVAVSFLQHHPAALLAALVLIVACCCLAAEAREQQSQVLLVLIVSAAIWLYWPTLLPLARAGLRQLTRDTVINHPAQTAAAPVGPAALLYIAARRKKRPADQTQP